MALNPPRRKGHYIVSRGRTQCYYCKCPFNWDDPTSEYYPTREHKQPRSKGGRNGHGNVVLACSRCNNEKGAMTLRQYMEYREVTKGCRGLVARKLRWKKHTGIFQKTLDARDRAETANPKDPTP